MATFFYTTGLKECLDGTIDLDTDTIKIVLLSNSTVYTPNKAHLVMDAGGANDPADAELDCTGYTAGYESASRKTATIAIAANLTSNRVEVSIQDETWTSVEAGYTVVGALLVKETALSDDTETRLIAYIDFPDQVTNGGDVFLDALAAESGGNLRIYC